MCQMCDKDHGPYAEQYLAMGNVVTDGSSMQDYAAHAAAVELATIWGDCAADGQPVSARARVTDVMDVVHLLHKWAQAMHEAEREATDAARALGLPR